MVSRHGFMQCKREHFPLGPGLWFVKIDKVGSCPRPVCCALTIVRGRGIRRRYVRDGFHSIRLTGQSTKDFDKIRINSLGQGLVSLEKLIRSFVEELRVCAQVIEE